MANFDHDSDNHSDDDSEHDSSSRWNEDIGRTLRDCCGQRSVALVLAHDVQAVCEAKFLDASDKAISFELAERQSLPAFRLASLCTVNFHHQSRLRLFVSRVLQFDAPRNGSVPGRLVVAMPRQLTAQDARLTTRVPVGIETGLSVRVQKQGGEAHDATPLNLSMSGILFELPQAWLEPDSDVEVQLRLGPTRVTLPGVVRRQHRDTCFGVMFPSAVEGDSAQTPAGLRHIVSELEGRWIRRPSVF